MQDVLAMIRDRYEWIAVGPPGQITCPVCGGSLFHGTRGGEWMQCIRCGDFMFYPEVWMREKVL
jgi:hypothetical protein